MRFELACVTDALKEWERLDRPIREQFKTKLAERLESPRVPSAKPSGHKDRHKVRPRSAGYRLVYEVHDKQVVVVVVAVGRRDRNAVYRAAAARVVESR